MKTYTSSKQFAKSFYNEDGTHNRDECRKRIEFYLRVFNEQLDGEREAPRNAPKPADVQKLFEKWLESEGVSTHHLSDSRTDAEKVVDSVNQIIQKPESIWELMDGEIDAVHSAFRTIATHTSDYLDHLANPDPDKPWPSQPPFKTAKEGEERLGKSASGSSESN